MSDYERAIYTLNQISIRGEEDASRLLGVINWIRQKEKESVTEKESEESEE